MIRKGDNVMVLSGRDRGKSGAVSRVIPKSGVVLVSGLNLNKKHQRPRKAGEKGQIIDKPMPLPVSRVALAESGKPVRIGFKMVGTKKVRVSRKSGKEL